MIVIAGMIVVAIVVCVLIFNSQTADEKENTEQQTGKNNLTVTENESGQESKDKPSLVSPVVTEEPTPVVQDSDEKQDADEKQDPDEKQDLNQKQGVKVILGDYKGIKVSNTRKEITDEDVDEKLKNLQLENSYYVNLPDRGIKEDDMVIVTINAFIDDGYVGDFSVNWFQVIVGENNIPDFMENAIIGKKIGDFVDVEYLLPEDYPEYPGFAGKKILYNLELVDGFERVIPEITDDFIQENSEYTSVEEYKTKMKEKMQAEEDQRARNEMLDSIKHTLISICSYSEEIDYEIKKAYVQKLQEKNAMAAEYGFSDGAMYYAYLFGMSLEEYQSTLEEEAEFEVKCQLALDEIAVLEKIKEKKPNLSEEALRNAVEQFLIESAKIDS